MRAWSSGARELSVSPEPRPQSPQSPMPASPSVPSPGGEASQATLPPSARPSFFLASPRGAPVLPTGGSLGDCRHGPVPDLIDAALAPSMSTLTSHARAAGDVARSGRKDHACIVRRGLEVALVVGGGILLFAGQASADESTTSADSVLGGNQVTASVTVPVYAGGSAVSVTGDSSRTGTSPPVR